MRKTIYGNKYALLLVDYTTYSWVYFMQSKGEAAHYVTHFIKERERQGLMVGKLRCDQGGGFSLKRGIVFAQSPAYTPQYQGKVERQNRTLGEMAHAMRLTAKLPPGFWELAWETAVLTRNRCPTLSNKKFQTPYEALYGVKPRVDNWKIFGCRAEALVAKAARLKEEDKTVSGIMVGYDESSRAYKFMPRGKKKWIATRTLICDEESIARR
jgi:hypothetical protein